MNKRLRRSTGIYPMEPDIVAWRLYDEAWQRDNASRNPLPRKIVCRICGLGPLDGVALRKIGWTWNCMQHPLRHRM